MKTQRFGLGLGLAWVLSSSFPAFAVQSAPIQEGSEVKWSEIVENPFDGTIVYDKHFTNRFTIVSSWSKQAIRVTYTEKESVFEGYQTVWETRWVIEAEGRGKHKKKQRLESYPTQQAVYRTVRTDFIPHKILFAIQNQLYSYEGGQVPDNLAEALANAPEGNMQVRLEWDTGKTIDVEIGKGTVKAWKAIFRSQK